MILTLCACLAMAAAPGLAFPNFQEQVPNGNAVPHPCKANYRWPGLGHENPSGGGSRNAFGRDFDEAGYRWSPDLCAKDSDGDGLTNGQELGDPNCVWRVGQTPEITEGITHPGVCDPYDSELCRDRNSFVSCALEGFEACDAINEPGVMQIDLRFTQTVIPPTETNYYCMTFDLPSDQDYHIIADEALIDNANVLHHMLVYGCETPDEAYIPTPQPCGMSAKGNCGTIIGAWTVGLAGTCYPDNAGFRIGQTGYRRIRLEIHYNNPALRSDYTDSSGLRLYYKPAEPGVQDLTTFMTGQTLLNIPPGLPRVEQVGMCPSDCLKYLINDTAYVISAMNHMHYKGRSMKIELFRDGKMIKELTNDEYYNYDSPITHVHEPPVEIRPGDEIKTTCVYNSLSTKKYVYFGEGTSDEMCFGFLTMYPKQNVPHPYCSSHGPLDVCQLFSGTPIGACDWATFTNLSHPTTSMMAQQIARDCNLDGFCRPECRDTLAKLDGHPCLKGEARAFVMDRLSDSHEGLAFLGRLHSCPAQDHDIDCKDKCHDICRSDDGGIHDSAPKMGAASFIVVVVTSLFALFV